MKKLPYEVRRTFVKMQELKLSTTMLKNETYKLKRWMND